MKRMQVASIITLSLLLVSLPIAFLSGGAFAQSAGYSISQVNHQITILYSGQVVIQDTIYISGQATNGFLIGLPAKYSTEILKAAAYDSNTIYPVDLGVQLENQSGFYGAEVNFNGNSPSVFTVAFVLSSSLITQTDPNDYVINFPAYPSLTQNVGACNVSLTFPSTPATITITKSDGVVNSENYATQNLPAYTYSVGSAAVKMYNGTMQLADISHLNSQITIDPTGKVTASDSYQVIDNSAFKMPTFILDIPSAASNIVVKDNSGTVLSTSTSVSNSIFLTNATLSTPLLTAESTIIIASYTLPSATIQGSQYTLTDFKLFADFNYYVDSASVTLNPPEGATIITPKLSSIDSSSTLTRNSFQSTLTITRDGISFVDYVLPGNNTLQFSYNYNPVWVSFMPTFWVSLLAVIGCVGAVVYKRRKPIGKETTKTGRERPAISKPSLTAPTHVRSIEPPSGQRITPENIRVFTDSYEDRKRLNAEIRSLDMRAQKGKIPRRQYKVQRRAIEIRLETLSRNTSRLKDVFRSSGSVYSDLMKQLDSAEANLAAADENISKLESQQVKGEISMETYKKNIADFQKQKDKAEAAINGILLRLREKGR